MSLQIRTINNRATECYQLISDRANNNAMIQGFSGFFGAVVTLAVDAGSVPLIYLKMWNDIRQIYGHNPIGNDAGLNVLSSILPEVLTDVLFDKVLGNVPVIGVYFNAICAKQMTWRLGTLFSMLSSRGSDVLAADCQKTMQMIRHMFPQRDMFVFATPDYHNFIDLVDGVKDNPVEEFNQKINQALMIMQSSTNTINQD